MQRFKNQKYFIIFLMYFISIGFCYPGGVGGNYANNAPNMRNCTSCHSGSVNSGNGNVTILGLPSDGYNPGESYSLIVKVTGTNRNGYGFQMASQVGNDNAGTFSLASNSQFVELSGSKVQQSARTISGEWVVDWIAPSSDVGDITFSASGLATGGTGSATSGSNSGDLTYAVSIDVPANVPQEVDLFFSEYIEGSSSNKAIEIFNPTGSTIDLSSYSIKHAAGGSGWGFHPDDGEVSGFIYPLSGSLDAYSVFILSADAATDAIKDSADVVLGYPSVCHFAGDDAIGLFKNDVLIDVIGIPTIDPGASWDVAGETGATKDHTLIRKSTVSTGNTDWESSAGTNAENSEWIVEDQNYFFNIGFHVFGDNAENILPIANAGVNQTVPFGSTVTLDGSSSVDPDGSITTYLWVQTAGQTVSLSSTNTAAVTFTAPSTVDSLSFTLQVTDDDGASSSETIYVKIVAPSPIFFSEYAEGGSGYNKYLEIYNSSNADVDLSGYAILGNGNGSPFSDTLNFESNTILASEEVYVIAHADADPIILAQADKIILNPFDLDAGDPERNFIVSFNGDDARAIAKIEGTSYNVVDIIGTLSDPGNGWEVAGVSNGTKDHTLVRKLSVQNGNPNWESSAGTTAENSEWEVKDDLDWTNIGCHSAECVSAIGPEITSIVTSPSFVTNQSEIEVSVSITTESGSIDENSVVIKFGTNNQLVNEAEMGLDGGNTYIGAIPAQQGNTLLQFRVHAKNSSGAEGQSDLFEVLVANSTPSQIADLHSSQSTDEIVTIKGIVTIGGSGLLYPTQTRAYIQDASGRGLQLFDFDLIDGINRGDELEVVGYSGYNFSTFQIKDFSFRKLSDGNDIPNPIELGAAEANSPDYEGTLIAVTGNITSISQIGSNGNNYSIDNQTSVVIWNSTGVNVTGLVEGYRGRFVGVGSKYQDTYQLLVAYDNDISTVVSVDLNDVIANEFSLLPAYPNPFNPVTNISFVVDRSSEVLLNIFNINGNLVQEFGSKVYDSGLHNIQWDASSLSSGMYFIHLINGDNRHTQKVMLMK